MLQDLDNSCIKGVSTQQTEQNKMFYFFKSTKISYYEHPLVFSNTQVGQSQGKFDISFSVSEMHGLNMHKGHC